MKVVRKILYWMLVSLLVVILGWNIWLAGIGLSGTGDLPSVFGYTQLCVLSGSMEPSFSAGDLVIIHKEKEYRPGDIITFRDEDSYVTHRITEAAEGGFITKGDANPTADRETVRTDQIEGKVILIIPWLGSILSFLKTPPGILLLLGAGLLLLLPERFWKRRREDCK